ncbi:ABC transporter permease [Priestia endophytica]|uniref:ABC transporter permease n=1 Tax=Priestia endophytica TaxID=135735 RepID=UPI00178C1ED7|nr:ABC transporter permease [Priestia endophytica]
MLKIEIYKLLKQKQIMIMGIFLIIAVLGMAVFNLSTQEKKDFGSNWKDELTLENQQRTKQNEKLPHTSLAYQNNLENIQLNNYRIEHNIKPNTDFNVWSFIDNVTPLISFVGIFIVVIASGIVSKEFDNGTIKLLFSRPITKTKLLISKYIAVIFINFLAIYALLTLSFIIGTIFFGYEAPAPHLYTNYDHIEEISYVLYLLRYYAFAAIDLAIFSTLAFTISTVFKNASISLAITLFLYFTSNIATRIIAEKFKWAKYILFANTDFNLYVEGNQIIKEMTPWFSIIACIVYLSIFLIVSLTAFNKKEIV